MRCFPQSALLLLPLAPVDVAGASPLFSESTSKLDCLFPLGLNVSGTTHIKRHTLDLVFSHGLNVDNLHVEDILLSDHSCIFFDTALTGERQHYIAQGKKHFRNQPVVDSCISLFDVQPVSTR